MGGTSTRAALSSPRFLSLILNVMPRAPSVSPYRWVRYEMPAVAAVVGGILGQELLRAVTGKGEPVRNAFFFSMTNSQGTIENLGCPR